ncbi:MAG: carboxypeptidase-like regulatory domain-containing protein [Terriglobia bacterium]
MRARTRSPVGAWLGALLVAALSLGAQEPPAQPQATGWICGGVVDETFSFVANARIAVYPQENPEAEEPVAESPTDAHGAFCLRDLPPGFYQLRVEKDPWPPQASRTVEVRAGLLNRLNLIELELEPGEPRVSHGESFDGMSPGEARGVLEHLLAQGDTISIREIARRLLPKRGPRIDIGRIVVGLDVKPLLEELVRQVESGYLPPLKTARYVYLIGELADPRTQDAVTQLLLRKLRDARPLPPSPYGADPGRVEYVSDYAIQALARLAGKDFGWQYGKPPVQNQRAIQSAQMWWQRELEKRQSDRR